MCDGEAQAEHGFFLGQSEGAYYCHEGAQGWLDFSGFDFADVGGREPGGLAECPLADPLSFSVFAENMGERDAVHLGIASSWYLVVPGTLLFHIKRVKPF